MTKAGICDAARCDLTRTVVCIRLSPDKSTGLRDVRSTARLGPSFGISACRTLQQAFALALAVAVVAVWSRSRLRCRCSYGRCGVVESRRRAARNTGVRMVFEPLPRCVRRSGADAYVDVELVAPGGRVSALTNA